MSIDPPPAPLCWLAPLAGHGVVVTDGSGITLWVNDEFRRSTGYGIDDLKGRKPGDVLQCPETDPATVKALGQAIAQGRPCTPVEILNRTKDGRPLWLLLDIVPVHDASGVLTHFYSVQSDVTARRQADAERACRIGLLQDLGLLGFWERDLDSGRAQWDTVCRQIWGLGLDEDALTLPEAERWLTGADRDALRRYQADLAAGLDNGDLSYSLKTRDGLRRVRSLWQRRANLVRGVLIDVTSEHALSQEHSRLLQLLSIAAPAASLVFWRHELGSGAVQWMPSGRHPFEADAHDLSDADRILASVLPEDRPAVLAAREQALRHHDVIELEYRAHDRHGQVRHFLTRRIGVAGTDGEVSEIIGVLIDVTVQRERELALRAMGARQALALRALRAGAFRYDCSSQRFEFDQDMRRLYGLAPSVTTLTFEQWLSLVHEDDRERVRQQSALLPGQPLPSDTLRFRIRHADGRVLWIEADQVAEAVRAGTAAAMVGTHRDVTAEVLAQQRSRDLAEARLVARTRAEFFATLAHELRTPLNAVVGFAQLLQMNAESRGPDAAVGRAAGQIRAAGDMMQALLDDAHDLAIVDAGALRWTAGAVAAAAMLEECCEWLRQRDVVTGRRICLEPPEPGLALWADPRRVRQIVLNLLTNALKYSEGDVCVTATYCEGQGRISVRDTGGGLTATQLERAFEPFERLGQELGDQPGSGLGLALCRRLARVMGGDIEVDSGPGQGSVFTVVLPLAAEAGAL